MVNLVMSEAGLFLLRFDPAKLQYHVVRDMKQTGLTPTTDGTKDQTEISHEMLIVVRDDAWPD
jgi:hypothetical protein